MIHVLNKRHENAYACEIVYVGRPSVLGNPFTVKEHGHGNAIKLYRKWLWGQMQFVNPQYREIMRLAKLYEKEQELALVCWCAPRPCHGAVIAKAIQYVVYSGV